MVKKKPKEKGPFYLRFMLFLTRIIPLRKAFAFCRFLGNTLSHINWKRKTIALNNIQHVFPEKSKKECFLIYKHSLVNMLFYYFELAYVASGSIAPEDILPRIDASGLEHLDTLRDGGNGALLYTGHFGNFPLMIFWLGLKGYPVAAIYKSPEDFPEDFSADLVKKCNVTPLPFNSDRELTVNIIRALKSGKIVLIQNDQSHPDGVYIDFFNKSVPSAPGPAILAKRVGVPIIPAYILRDGSNHHNITIFPEMKIEQRENHDEFVRVNTQNQVDWIAEILKKYPNEWLWMHNRWKRARD